MKVRFYSIRPYSERLLAEFDPKHVQGFNWDVIIRKAGFSSCRFIPMAGGKSYWVMDNDEFILFVLKYSGV